MVQIPKLTVRLDHALYVPRSGLKFESPQVTVLCPRVCETVDVADADANPLGM